VAIRHLCGADAQAQLPDFMTEVHMATPHSMESSTKNQSFPFPPLPDARSFRLLRILKSQHAFDQPCFELSTFPLDIAPQYYALSYNWGSPFPKRDEVDDKALDWDNLHKLIYCNNLPYFTGQNLYDALSEISRECPEIYLWVDSICISQNDLEEKNNQVSLMGNIFASAENVFCWLGREDAYSLRATQLIKLLSQIVYRMGATDGGLRSTLQLDVEGALVVSMMNEIANGLFPIETPPPSLAHWQDWAVFCQRRYFSRLWIVQELGLAKTPILICGIHRFSWVELQLVSLYTSVGTWVAHFMRKYGLLYNGLRPAQDPGMMLSASLRSWQLEDFKRTLREQLSLTADSQVPYLILMESLARTSEFGVTDPHDRIYALLGLARLRSRQPDAISIKPQYASAVDLLYLEVTKISIENLPILMSLAIVEDRTMRRTHTLPSWVPDFNLQQMRANDSTSFPMFRAGISCTGPNMQCRIIEETRLTLHGVFIDKIAGYTETSGAGFHLYTMAMLNSMVELVLALPLIYQPTGQDRLEAFWRTLVWDTDRYIDGRATATTGEFFPQWLAMAFVDPFDHDWNLQQVDALKELLLTLVRSSSFADEYLSQRPLRELQNGEVLVADQTTVEEIARQAQSFLRHCQWQSRKLVRTSYNFLGTALPSAAIGDQVWILKDARLPVVLRPVGGTNFYEFVGEAYIHGISFGETLEKDPSFGPVVLV
jgi:Heterokaryon incompatibility protein (HET)